MMAPEMDKIKRSGEENGHMIKLAILLGKMLKYKTKNTFQLNSKYVNVFCKQPKDLTLGRFCPIWPV